MPKATKRTRTSKDIGELRRRLAEAEQTLQAIHSGQVDAVVVAGPAENHVYALKEALLPYQVTVEEMTDGALTLSGKGGIILYANRRAAEIFKVPTDKLLGNLFADFIAPADQPAAAALLLQSLEAPARGELALSAQGQALVPVELSIKRVMLDGLPRLMVIMTDISERKQTDAARQAALRQAHAGTLRAEILMQAATRLNEQLDLAATLHSVCEQAAHAVNATATWINLYDPVRARLDYAASFGLPPQFAERYQSPPRVLFEEYARRINPLVLPDVQALRDIPNADLYAALDIRTIANVRMQRQEELIGVLSVPIFGQVREFDEEELALLRGLAELAAQAIANARLHHLIQDQTAELERRVSERTAQLQAANEELQKDLVERQRLEQELTWLASFPHLNPHPVAEVDLNGTIYYLNPAAEEVFPDLYLRGHEHPWLADWESITQPFRQGQRVAQTRELQVGETWYLQSFYFVHETQRIRIYALDVTVRKQAEESIHRSEGRFRSLFENMLDGYAYCWMMYDEQDRPVDFVYLETNAAFERLTGLQHAVGRRVTELISGIRESSPGLFEIYGRVARHGTPERFEAFFESLHAWLVISVYSPQKDHFVAVFDNITERKRAEEALARQSAELARSNAELEQFAYVASHDLQEPLRKIQAFGDRLRTRAGEALDGPSREDLERMLNAGSRMSTMLDDLLTYSRVSHRRNPFAAVDLAAVARDVLSMLETRIEQTHGRVEVGELPTIEADRTQMEQLLQNLIANALKFHAPGQAPEIHLDARAVSESEIQFSVRDNGIGFDEKYLDRIFQPFQRLHSRSETEYPGHGIGLAICRKIAERHGGSITATSQPGQGATFIVTLPREHPADRA